MSETIDVKDLEIDLSSVIEIIMYGRRTSYPGREDNTVKRIFVVPSMTDTYLFHHPVILINDDLYRYLLMHCNKKWCYNSLLIDVNDEMIIDVPIYYINEAR